MELLFLGIGIIVVPAWLLSLSEAATAGPAEPLPVSCRMVSATGRFAFFVGLLAVAMDKAWQTEGHLYPLALGTGMYLGCQLAYGISVVVYASRDLSPGTPEGLEAAVHGLDVTLSWKPVPEAKEYCVFRKAAGEESEALVETCATTRHLDRVPKAGSYSYHVKTVSERGESRFSDYLTVDCEGPR